MHRSQAVKMDYLEKSKTTNQDIKKLQSLCLAYQD